MNNKLTIACFLAFPENTFSMTLRYVGLCHQVWHHCDIICNGNYIEYRNTVKIIHLQAWLFEKKKVHLFCEWSASVCCCGSWIWNCHAMYTHRRWKSDTGWLCICAAVSCCAIHKSFIVSDETRILWTYLAAAVTPLCWLPSSHQKVNLF